MKSRMKNSISKLVLAVSLVLLVSTLSLSAEDTYEDFRNGTWKSIDFSNSPDEISIDLSNYDAPSRWNSRVLDSQRESTVWRRIYFNSTETADHDVKARIMTADRFLKFGSLPSNNNTRFTGWKNAPGSFSYLDFRSNDEDMLETSIRGLNFDADTQSPELWYSLEGLDTKIKDFSSNSRHAEMSTSGLRTSNGYSGSALQLSSGNHLTLSNSQTITNPAGDMTIEMWVNPSSLDSSSETLIDKENEFRLNLENNGEVWLRTYGDNNRGVAGVSSNSWTHIAVRWLSNDKIITYIDGEKESEVNINDQSSKTSNNIYVGRTFDNNQYYDGKIDELRIFRNTTKPDFLTNITDFTASAEPSGSDIGPISKDYAQVKYQPDDGSDYTVDLTRIASDKDYSPWRQSGGSVGDVLDERYGIIQVNMSTTDLGSSPSVSGVRVQTAAPVNITPEETPVSGDTAARYRDDLAINVDLNQTNYSTTDPLTLDYTLFNLKEYCDFNEGTGYCERLDNNEISTNDARLMTNEEPLYKTISHTLYGSERVGGQVDFTVPFSYWTNWNTQVEQYYNHQSQLRSTVSNNVLQPSVITRKSEGGSCDYVTDCRPGLYCADADGDSDIDTCKQRDSSLSGNRCELIGAGAKERISNSGYCKIAYPDAEERNIPSGNVCEQSADCTTNYCYDNTGDGTKRCQTTPASGSNGGDAAGGQSGDADSCYFAGKVYSPGSTVDIFSDGIQNQCVNGKWEQEVKAKIDYSDVKENGQIDIDYNVFNFREGFTYNNGYVERNNSNDIQLQRIRVGISGETFEKSISGTVGGKRNLSGSITINVPEISHTDDLQANTYLEYDRGGNTYTIAATPLFGGDHEESLNSGSCRKGWQVEGSQYCVYNAQEDSYGSGAVVSSSTLTGNLCTKRTADNIERRVAPTGTCQVSGAGAGNNNLPNGYVCETKEDCISDYCYDVGGAVKSCQSTPESGTNSGILASSQSCQDNSCFYEGQCYSEGTSISGFQQGSSMTCSSGSWGFQDDIAFKMDVPDQSLDGTVSIDFEFQNLRDYCDYIGLECRVIEDNIITLENITFSVKDKEPFTRDIEQNISGQGSYNEQLNVNIPDLDYTQSSRIRAVLVYERNDTLHQAVTPNVFRGQTWKKETSGSCLAGYETDKGYFCEFEGADQLNSGSGSVKSSSTDAGDLCKTEGASSTQRISLDGSCKLAGPGVENENVPLGNQCQQQSDCINNFCHDSDNDTVMSCQDTVSQGSEDGVLVSDNTDCAENSCYVRDQCFSPGSEFEYQNQTFTCDDGDVKGLEQGELSDNVTTPKSEEPSDISATVRKIALGLKPNVTSFQAGQPVRFNYTVRNFRDYCQENDATGLCTRVDSELLELVEARGWFDNSLKYRDQSISIYGEEKKSGEFTMNVPEATAAYDFRSEIQYNITSSGALMTVASSPYFDNQFERSSEGESCRYMLDCQEGLYCGDTDGDSTPDTCRAEDSSISGNICEYYGSGSLERVGVNGSCQFAQPGFENHNIPQNNQCRTTEDCVTDYCYDDNDDGIKTCQTDQTTGDSDGVVATPDSCGTNSCFYGGQCYESGTDKDINQDASSAVCQNGVWQDKMNFNAEVPFEYSETDTITINYDLQNPRECDKSNGFCMKDTQNAVELNNIVVNIAGEKYNKSISGTVLPERNNTGNIQVTLPQIHHTQIMDARIFLNYYDRKTDSTEVITTRPAVRGATYSGKDSGTCSTGFRVAGSMFCEYNVEESPSNEGLVVDSGTNPGNLCSVSEATASEHRVTTSGGCKPAGQGYENRNLPDGYECTTEKDCISDYCYDVGGAVKTCQSVPNNGTNSGILGARQSGSSTTCKYAGRIYSDGTQREVFGKQATCNQGRWSYDSEVGFKAEIPESFQPGDNVQIDYSMFNPYQYCSYSGNNCTVIEENIAELENMTIEFRNDNKTVDLSERIAGGQRVDGSFNVQVPDFGFTDNIPITAKVVMNYTSYDGTTERIIASQKTDVLVRGSDWENKTAGQCLGGLDAATDSFCLFNNQTDVNYGQGDVRFTSNSPGEICETPQMSTQLERVTESGECKPAQAGAQNSNQPDSYACQNQADCISDYCYDKNEDSKKECRPSPSTGSDDGIEVSERSDCGSNSCWVRGQCYQDGTDIPIDGETRYCDSGEIRETPPAKPVTDKVGDIFTEFRDYTFEVVDRVINSNTLQVEFELTNQESDDIEVEDTYIMTGSSAEKLVDGPFTLSTGQSETFSITTEKPLSGVKQIYADAYVEQTSDIQQWIASNSTCYVANWNGFQETCIRDDPQIDEVEFNDYPASHRYNISIFGNDPDGASDLNACTIQAEEEDGTQRTFSGFIDTGYGRDSEYKCTFDNINESITGFEPKDYVRHVISVTDTSGKTGTEIERHRVPNRAPSHDKPSINPDPALSGDDLTAVPQSVNDVEGDTVNLEYNWTVNGNNLEFGTQTLNSGNYSVGDFVTLYVTPSDTYDKGETKSRETQIRSAVVNIIDIVFEDYSDDHAFNATAQVNATDPTGIETCEVTLGDGDSSYTFSGTVNESFGENDQVSCYYNNVSSAIGGFEPTEEIEVEFYVEDENDAQDTRLEQHNIPNTPPETDSPTISPSSPTTFDDLQANNGSSSDLENDSISFQFDWYVNEDLQVQDDSELLSNNFTGGDNITLEANPTDGYEFGAANNTTVQIEEANLVVSNLTFQDYASEEAFNTTADITAPDPSSLTRCDVTADDSDGNKNIYRADINTSFGGANDAKCTYSNINSSITGFESGEELDIKVNVTDGGATAFQERSHELPDLTLNVWNLTFTKVEGQHAFDVSSIVNATDADNIESCSFEASDGEGNITSSTGNLNKNYGDSTQARCTYSSFGISDTGFELFENLTVNASADSSAEFDSEIGYQVVPNSAPDINEVFTDPLSPIDQDDVEVRANVSDDEEDGIKWVNFTVTHEDGTELVGNTNGTVTNPIWASPEFSVEPETQYNWTVKAKDPYNVSVVNGSFSTVNQPPEVTDIEVNNNTGEHGYQVEWEIEDPDGGDDIQNCQINASDGEGNTFEGDASIEPAFGSYSEARCVYNSINASITGFDVNELVDFTLKTTDSADQNATNTSSSKIPNRAPEVALGIPSDGAGVGDPVDLGWSSNDVDGDSLQHRVIVSSNSDLSSPEIDTLVSPENYEVSLSQGTYYWQVNTTDGYETSASEIRTLDVIRQIENVSVRMTGDYPNVVVDGETRSQGTYQDMDYPYIAMEGTNFLEGIVAYRGAIESDYRNNSGDDVIEIKKDFNGERFLVAGFEGGREELQQKETMITNSNFLDSPMPAFTREIDSSSLISAILRYQDIDVKGRDGRITPGSSVELIIRNSGTEDGNITVELKTQ